MEKDSDMMGNKMNYTWQIGLNMACVGLDVGEEEVRSQESLDDTVVLVVVGDTRGGRGENL